MKSEKGSRSGASRDDLPEFGNGLKERSLKYAIDSLGPGIIDSIQEALQSDEHKVVMLALQGLEKFSQAGLMHLQSATLDQEMERHQECFKELKRFLSTVHDVVYEKPSQLSDAERRLLPQKLTPVQEQRQKEKVEIAKKYIQQVPVKVPKLYGANLRDWWIDKKLPVDEDGHPDLRWLKYIDGWQSHISHFLMGANVSGFNLSGLDFSGVNLQFANLSAAIMRDVTFDKTTNIINAFMVQTDLSGAQVSRITDKEEKSCTFDGITGEALEQYLKERQVVLVEAIFKETEHDPLEFTFIPKSFEEEKPIPSGEGNLAFPPLSSPDLVGNDVAASSQSQGSPLGEYTSAEHSRRASADNVVPLEKRDVPSSSPKSPRSGSHVEQQQQRQQPGLLSSIFGGGRA